VNVPRSWLLVVAAIAVVAIITIPLLRQSAPSTGGPAGLEGSIAPSFAVSDGVGRPAALSDYRGKIVVMNLWASWCPPCRAEMPDLDRFYRAYRARNVIVLGVDEGEAAPRAMAFARALGITYPILIDRDQRYGRVYAALGLPTTIVIDARGVVERGFDGPLTERQMRDAIAPLLARR
jgi:thiol-disulfide isomerase/thioredoxin